MNNVRKSEKKGRRKMCWDPRSVKHRFGALYEEAEQIETRWKSTDFGMLVTVSTIEELTLQQRRIFRIRSPARLGDAEVVLPLLIDQSCHFFFIGETASSSNSGWRTVECASQVRADMDVDWLVFRKPLSRIVRAPGKVLSRHLRHRIQADDYCGV